MSFKHLLITILLLSGLKAVGQAPILNAESYKPGIYMSFEEFLNNAPSVPLTYEVKAVERGYGFMKAAKMLVYRLKIKKKEGAKLDRIFGFFDGKDLYIQPEMVKQPGPKDEFFRVLHLGDMTYYKARDCTTKFVDALDLPSTRTTCDLAHQLLNLRTGKTVEVTYVTLKTLLAPYPELLEAYQAEKDKKSKVRNYVIQYLARKENEKSE